MPLRILITGASGFIGSNLVASMEKRGVFVFALTKIKTNVRGATKVANWSLGDDLPEEALQPFDVAIHLAHDFDGNDGGARTLKGTVNAIQALRNAGTKRQIFFSSLSAQEEATSCYGRTKLAIERQIAAYTDIVIIRPGLVLGDGGLFGRIRRWIRGHSFVPLPDGGKGRVGIIDVEKLCRQTIAIMSLCDEERREFNLFEIEQISLRQLVENEAQELGRQIFIIPVPSSFLLKVLAAAEAMKLRLPVNSDNLAGFLANQSHLHRPTSVESQ